jgi:hypothetical protein
MPLGAPAPSATSITTTAAANNAAATKTALLVAHDRVLMATAAFEKTHAGCHEEERRRLCLPAPAAPPCASMTVIAQSLCFTVTYSLIGRCLIYLS